MNDTKKAENIVTGLIHVKYIDKLKDNKPNRICFLIDGGINCKSSFNITIKEFLPRLKNRELIGCHIYNNEYNSEFNWQYQKNYILDQYLFTFDRIIKYPNLFYLQDKKYFHNIRQAYEIASNLSSKYFIFDFYSLKEQDLLVKNIFYGLNFLLTENNIPTLIMKDELTRSDKEKGINKHKGYTWLVLFDGTNLKSFNVLEYFWPFIDKKKDFIYVLTIINNSFYSDRIKNIFFEKMKKFNLKECINFRYSLEIVENKKYFKFLKEFINFNEDYYFDFLLFYNNPLKYKIKKNFSYELIMEMRANIGFINMEEVEENFNSEDIIDYEEIQRIEKEELRKKRLLDRARLEEEREVIRQYQAIQFALFSEYEEKKLERQDTNTSLLNESKLENNNNSIISNLNNEQNNNFIISKSLIHFPLINNQNSNNRYNEEKKNETPIKNKNKNSFSTRNLNNNTINTAKSKSKTVSKITIQAKTSEEINEKKYTKTFYKTNKSFNKYEDKKSLNNIKQQNIRPLNLKEKLNIYARNKNVKFKLKQ